MSSQANLSEEVVQSMQRANDCNLTNQNYVYTECMLINNQKITKSILRISQQKIKDYSANKKQTTIKNIDAKIIWINRHCLNEQTKFGDSMNGERRHPYCVYENRLELLINVQQRIHIYAQ